ncbi:MAG: proton-conducting transporter membrane subunit [Anaerolineae bacterium]|nr:proton-conducting transporter membrane subunit [Anaerolineae bacterium]
MATQIIGFTAGTYEIAEIVSRSGDWLSLSNSANAFLGISVGTVKSLAFFGFMVAFGIKVPIWPFHTWLLMPICQSDRALNVTGWCHAETWRLRFHPLGCANFS